jgi:signal transduction histidine kinase
MHKDVLDQKNVTIDIGKLPVIHAIAFQIKQLLDNLISNAIKYKQPDLNTYIRISCEVVEGSDIIEKGVDDRKKYYQISITDNGLGFEPQYAEKIFELFQRLNGKTNSSGSGIGLAICKKIVQNHRGVIKATGKLNEGARFDIYIPVMDTKS